MSWFAPRLSSRLSSSFAGQQNFSYAVSPSPKTAKSKWSNKSGGRSDRRIDSQKAVIERGSRPVPEVAITKMTVCTEKRESLSNNVSEVVHTHTLETHCFILIQAGDLHVEVQTTTQPSETFCYILRIASFRGIENGDLSSVLPFRVVVVDSHVSGGTECEPPQYYLITAWEESVSGFCHGGITR